MAQNFVPYRLLGGFRIALALLVVIQHFGAHVAPRDLAQAFAPYEVGSVAVLAFFALSGFVIGEAADRVYQHRPVEFLTNRFLRILPQYLLVVLTAIVLLALLDRFSLLPHEALPKFSAEVAFAPRNLAANLIGVFPLADRFIAYNFVEIAWAIRVEMAFYLVVAGLLLIGTLFRGRQVAGIPIRNAAEATVLLALVPLFLLALAGRGIAMFQYVPYFVFGYAFYRLLWNANLVNVLVVAVSLAGIAIHFVSLPVHHPALGYARAELAQFGLLAGLLGLFVWLAVANGTSLARADRFLGELTYPLYLWHLNVMILVAALAGRGTGALVFGIGASLAVAWLAHQVFDPLVNQLRDTVRGGSLASGSLGGGIRTGAFPEEKAG